MSDETEVHVGKACSRWLSRPSGLDAFLDESGGVDDTRNPGVDGTEEMITLCFRRDDAAGDEDDDDDHVPSDDSSAESLHRSRML